LEDDFLKMVGDLSYCLNQSFHFFDRVSMVSSKVGFLPEDFFSIDLLVVPLWGLGSVHAYDRPADFLGQLSLSTLSFITIDILST
jgi:hypothetical protein